MARSSSRARQAAARPSRWSFPSARRPAMYALCARAAVCLTILLGACAPAFALNPALDISQYAHTSWKARDGVFKGQITAITQSPDGYLWLGTEFGVLRFDGVRFVAWEPPPTQSLPSNFIVSLLTARDGTV